MDDIEKLTLEQYDSLIHTHSLYRPHSGIINVYIRYWSDKINECDSNKYKRNTYHEMLRRH